jgi:hypothetical protein
MREELFASKEDKNCAQRSIAYLLDMELDFVTDVAFGHNDGCSLNCIRRAMKILDHKMKFITEEELPISKKAIIFIVSYEGKAHALSWKDGKIFNTGPSLPGEHISIKNFLKQINIKYKGKDFWFLEECFEITSEPVHDFPDYTSVKVLEKALFKKKFPSLDINQPLEIQKVSYDRYNTHLPEYLIHDQGGKSLFVSQEEIYRIIYQKLAILT